LVGEARINENWRNASRLAGPRRSADDGAGFAPQSIYDLGQHRIDGQSKSAHDAKLPLTYWGARLAAIVPGERPAENARAIVLVVTVCVLLE
jgi:hypothetical protein